MATKILLVEDYLVQSIGLWNLLKFWGYDMCRQVTSGEDAIEKVQEEKPHVVLMDINLGGEMNGIDAAREIRSRFGVPVIFTTACSDQKTIEIAKTAEPFGYFVKPLDFYKLRTVIDSIVNRSNRYFIQGGKKKDCQRNH
jgi:DNA-binding NarL/FixJ family response regulator